ncbi:MAG: PRC-barrel domain-containing protein [Candidatus Aenigmarchaeota archaeon]|nr:PRC-barrel domain-containing protein [Candidatus Aenigmarchaeota archaeon]
MPINVKTLSEITGKDVFTDKGVYCGSVEDVKINFRKFRVKSLIISVAKGSYLSEIVGRKKGIVIPYPMVLSIGDIVIVKHIVPAAIKGTDIEEETAE